MFSFHVGHRYYSIDTTLNHIESIVLFGSYLNGDFDKKSDIDLLFIIEDCSKEQLLLTSQYISRELHVPMSWINVQFKSFIVRQAKRGNYFLWSLKIAGKILYSKTGFIEHQFKHLALYTHVRSDVLYVKDCFQKKLEAYKMNKISIQQMICFTAVSVRKIFLYLAHIEGMVEFNKFDCARHCFALRDLKLPFSMQDYVHLYEFKRSYHYYGKSFYFKGDMLAYLNDWTYQFYELISITLREFDKAKESGFRNPLIPYLS